MKTYQQPWDNFARRYLSYTPPVIPSKQDIRSIELYLKKILKKNKDPNVLILGCTVNYRKLFSEYRLKVDLVDAASQMFMYDPKTLNRLKRKERFIKSNWVNMSLEKKYDLIVGDFVIHNVPFSKRPQFYRNIKRHLKDGGLFITRAYFHPIRFKKEKELISEYRKKPMNLRTLTEISFDFTFEITFDKRMNRGNNRKAYLAMKKAGDRYPFFKRWAETYGKKFPVVSKFWTLLPYKKQKSQLKKYLNMMGERYSKDYRHCNLCPTYILKK